MLGMKLYYSTTPCSYVDIGRESTHESSSLLFSVGQFKASIDLSSVFKSQEGRDLANNSVFVGRSILVVVVHLIAGPDIYQLGLGFALYPSIFAHPATLEVSLPEFRP